MAYRILNDLPDLLRNSRRRVPVLNFNSSTENTRDNLEETLLRYQNEDQDSFNNMVLTLGLHVPSNSTVMQAVAPTVPITFAENRRRPQR